MNDGTILTDDFDAWKVYPKLRHWYDKLWLSMKLGYSCGPCGLPIPKEGHYVIRPIYNLRGMGLAAEYRFCERGWRGGAPGLFWCEAFTGAKLSLDLMPAPHEGWFIKRAYQAHGGGLGVPWRWERKNKLCGETYYDGSALKELHAAHIPINIETVGGNIVEVHLRHSPDPDAKFLYPVSTDFPKKPDNIEEHGDNARFVLDHDDCDGYLTPPRLGFWAVD